MTDQHKALFASTIAYGIVFLALLLAGGIAIDKPAVVKLAVLAAGGSYLTQAVGATALASDSTALGRVATALWAATIVLGLWAAILLVV